MKEDSEINNEQRIETISIGKTVVNIMSRGNLGWESGSTGFEVVFNTISPAFRRNLNASRKIP